MHEFNQSLRYDKRMHSADIRGSIAYAKALTKRGILTDAEQKLIVDGLEQVEREWASGSVSHFSVLVTWREKKLTVTYFRFLLGFL